MKRFWVGLFPLLFGLLPLGACGGVSINEGESSQPLILLELYPRDGEQNIPVDVQILAVFSDTVFTNGCQEGLPSAGVFALELCPADGAPSPVEATASCYQRLDENNQPSGEARPEIVSLIPDQSLQAESRYCLSIAGTLAGASTSALGADIESTFTTGP